MSSKAKNSVATRATGRGRANDVCPWEDVPENGRGLHIDQFLTFHVVRLANAVKTNVTRRYLIDFGLSVPEWRLLALAMRFAPLRFSEIVARSNMDKGQVSRTLQSMTKRGFISAKTIGAKSRRARETISLPVIVSVTPKGRKLYQEVLPVAQRNQARLLHLMGPSERKTLYTVLTRLFLAVDGYRTQPERHD